MITQPYIFVEFSVNNSSLINSRFLFKNHELSLVVPTKNCVRITHVSKRFFFFLVADIRYRISNIYFHFQTLTSMGLKDLFGPSADLSRLSDAHISFGDAVHKARLELDEEGKNSFCL